MYKLLDSDASASIVHEDVLYKHHGTHKDKRINGQLWQYFCNTLNHFVQIYAKYHLTNKLLNYNLILGRDLLHLLGIIFNF